MSTFVLIHGAYHGAWCWHEVRAELEARDHEAVSFDLPAHGIDTTPVAEVTFDDYVARVRDAIDAQDEPVVLVGHSMAGMVITEAAQRRPDAIDTLVYLTAYLPADGESMLDQRIEGSLISRNFTADEERGVGVVAADALDELFYADCSAPHRALARSLVRPEPLAPLSEPVTVTDERFGTVRRVYVRCENDRAITPTQQRTMCEERSVDEELTLTASHSPFLAVPTETATALERASGSRSERVG